MSAGSYADEARERQMEAALNAVKVSAPAPDPVWLALAHATLTEAIAERDKINRRIANLERLERLASTGGTHR